MDLPEGAAAAAATDDYIEKQMIYLRKLGRHFYISDVFCSCGK